MAALYSNWEKECASPGTGPNGTKTLEDAIKETDKLIQARTAEAAVALLDKGEYLTFLHDTNEVEKAPFPSGAVPCRTYNAVEVDGKMWDVLVIVAEDDPLVKPVSDERRMMVSAKSDQDIVAFNGMPLTSRRQRIDKHISAVAGVRDIVQNHRYQGPEKDRRLTELFADMLPSSWTYETTTYFVGKK